MDQEKRNYFKAWLCYSVLATIGGFFGGFIGGAIFGFFGGFYAGISGNLDAAPQIARQFATVGGVLFSLPISFVCYVWTAKRFLSTCGNKVPPMNDSVPVDSGEAWQFESSSISSVRSAAERVLSLRG